jgi:hypothetical protein
VRQDTQIFTSINKERGYNESSRKIDTGCKIKALLLEDARNRRANASSRHTGA